MNANQNLKQPAISYRGTIIINEKRKVLFWDVAMEQILGYPAQEVMDKDIDRYLSIDALTPGLKLQIDGIHKSGLIQPVFCRLSYLRQEHEHLGVIEVQTHSASRQEYESTDLNGQQMLNAFDDLNAAAVIFELDGTITAANKQFLEKLSITRDQLQERRFASFLDPRIAENIWGEIQQIQYLEQQSRYMEFKMVPESGGILFAGARINFNPNLGDSGTSFLGIIYDRTEYFAYETELNSRERFVRAVLQSSPIVFYIYDLIDRKCIFSNQGIGRILGYSKLGGIEIGEGFFPSLIHPDDKENVENYHQEIGKSVVDGIYETRYRVKAANGTWHWMFSRDSILKRNSQGQVLQIVGTAQDISEEVKAQQEIKALNVSLEDRVRKRTAELHQANKELERMATIDFLTEIYNRRFFYQRANEEIQRCRRYGHPMTFLMMDIDHFKQVNDQHGHDIGDKVLIEFAKMLGKLLRKTDLFGRLGGEEFGVVLVETRLEQAELVANRFRTAISELSIDIGNDQTLGVTVSIGLAAGSRDIELDMLQKRADEALYIAKDAGRNRVAIWEHSANREMESVD